MCVCVCVCVCVLVQIDSLRNLGEGGGSASRSDTGHKDILWRLDKIVNMNIFCNLHHGIKYEVISSSHSLSSSLPCKIWLSCLVRLLSPVWLFATPWTAAHQPSLSIVNSWSLPKLIPIELVMPSNHLILYRPFLLWPSICPSIRVFSNESALHIRWPKYWSFSFSISPSNEYSGLIFFIINWLDLLAVQGTLKSLLQGHSSKASILWCSAFFIVQLSHPYMTTGKTIPLTRHTLLFNMLSRLVITFLPRSKCFLISWLQSPSTVI